MSYKASFEGWENLKLVDLLVAYRKAKADRFFENNIFPTAIKFAEYEENLLKNLETLLKKLKSKKGFSERDEFLGNCRLIPKKLNVKHSEGGHHVHFSDLERAVNKLPKEVTPEFRIVGDFPVDTHIISALWINMVGHKFDACLDDKHCYASRLKRINSDEEICLKGKQKEFHLESIGSFEPYFQPYQSFRRDGIEAMRNELNKEEDIVAVSLDLKSYYHTLDPEALASKDLAKCLGLKLTEVEEQFTEELSTFLSAWSSKASSFLPRSKRRLKEVVPGGLVIGLTVSSIIANVMLYRWDQVIKQKLAPTYYGRYVDDMFIVLRDPGDINCMDDFMGLLMDKLGESYLTVNENGICEIQQNVDIQGESKICFQTKKQKLFVLSGQTGLDLLDNIEEEIRELSSERRLMPSPSDLESSSAVRVLSSISSIGERADTLRRSDGLTIQRLGLALHLRHIETLARDLPSGEWKKERLDFYEFAQNHILCALNLFNNFRYIPRIIGLAVSCGEWKRAICIIEFSFHSLEQLSKYFGIGKSVFVNGLEIRVTSTVKKTILNQINDHFAWMIFDASVRHMSNRTTNANNLKNAFLVALRQYAKDTKGKEMLFEHFTLDDTPRAYVNNSPQDLDATSLLSDYSAMLEGADLASKSYKDVWNKNYFRQGVESSIGIELTKPPLIEAGKKVKKIFEDADFSEMNDLVDFQINRKKSVGGKAPSENEESPLPYLFPTRPYTPADIAELIPECIYPDDGSRRPSLWLRYTKALRGISVRNNLAADEGDVGQAESSTFKTVSIGMQKKQKITIALSNFKTDDQEWKEMANGSSKLRLTRYKRIADLVNQTINLELRPDYLLFPELSIPIEWIDGVATKLMSAGISLIAGTEYRHHEKNKIFSEACLVLSDDRLGFPSWVKIWQPKGMPAVSEEKDLLSKFGKTWESIPQFDPNTTTSKKVYNHNGFHFALMICSELQNSKSRIELQGNIDALFVLAWNQDLDTFASLLESASLDIHAYTILVNNRKYGDSRVRSPAKKSFKRDLARVRGGNNDYIVSVTLNVESLRAFQSRDKRWPEPTDKFKPVPEGYKINPSRKMLPSIK